MRAPWFAAAVIGTLAIAIGGSTTVFSVVNGVLLRPLPYRSSDGLVAIINTGPRPADNISPRDVADLQDGLPGLILAAYYKDPLLTLETGTEPLRVAVTDVSANWFALFGLPMELGRPFADGEDREGAARVVVLSDRFWRSHFGADPGILRHTLRLNDTSYRVIGVAPTRLAFPDVPDLWKPMILSPQIADRGARFALAVGRLAPGTSLAQGRAELATVGGRIHDAYPEIETGLHYDLAPLQHFIVGSVGPVLLVLLGGVGCLLLIACANVTNLFLVRATGRATEIGVRVALGARRSRIAREFVSECLLLALAGAAIGTLLAAWAIHAVVAMDAGGLPRITDVVIDTRVLAVTLGATCGAAVLMGLLPALHLSGADALSAVRAGSRAVSAEKRSGQLRRAFIVGELALAVPLLIGAGLLARSLLRLLDVDPGFRPEHVVRFSVVDLDTVPGRLRSFTDEYLGRLRAMPGSQDAAAGLGVPFSGMVNGREFHIVGHAPEPHDRPNFAWYSWATPTYFSTLGIPVLRGRAFTDADGVHGHLVVLVNQALVRKFFDGEDPLGRTLTMTPVRDSAGALYYEPIGEIVGVVGNTKTQDLARPDEPAMYIPYNQVPIGYWTFVVRSAADPATVLAGARTHLAALDPQLAISDGAPLVDAVGASAAQPRLDAWVVSGFGAVALLLAVVGIYGVIAYAVRDRYRELGIRLALGARSGQVVGLVLRQGAVLATTGISIGVVLAILGSRVLKSLLYGIAPMDAPTYILIAGLVASVAAVAAWVPARRAAMVDPVIAMRSG